MAESSSEQERSEGESRADLARPRRRDRFSRTGMLDRFELVLLLVLATIAVQGMVDVRGSVLAQLFTHAIAGLALVAAVRASGAGRRWRRAVDVLVAAVLLLSLVVLAVRWDDTTSGVPPETTWLLAASLTPFLVARRVLQHEIVTLQTIMGAVAAYLQIAVAYAFLYQTMDAFTTARFFGSDVSTTVYMYFSLVTISTVGYGDYTAAHDLGRMAAGSEAVLGQVFLVTFVALIVSRFAAHMPFGRPRDGAPQVGGRAIDQPIDRAGDGRIDRAAGAGEPDGPGGSGSSGEPPRASDGSGEPPRESG